MPERPLTQLFSDLFLHSTTCEGSRQFAACHCTQASWYARSLQPQYGARQIVGTSKGTLEALRLQSPSMHVSKMEVGTWPLWVHSLLQRGDVGLAPTRRRFDRPARSVSALALPSPTASPPFSTTTIAFSPSTSRFTTPLALLASIFVPSLLLHTLHALITLLHLEGSWIFERL